MTGYTEDRLVRDGVAMAVGTEEAQNGVEDNQAELDRATVQDGVDLDAVPNDEGVVVTKAHDDEEDEDVVRTMALDDVANQSDNDWQHEKLPPLGLNTFQAHDVNKYYTSSNRQLDNFVDDASTHNNAGKLGPLNN